MAHHCGQLLRLWKGYIHTCTHTYMHTCMYTHHCGQLARLWKGSGPSIRPAVAQVDLKRGARSVAPPHDATDDKLRRLVQHRAHSLCTCTCTYVRMYVCTCMLLCMYMCMHMRMCMRTCAYVCSIEPTRCAATHVYMAMCVAYVSYMRGSPAAATGAAV